MSKIKGTVSRAGKSKFSYFIQLDGNDFYYNTKFEPKCGEGDVVGVEFKPQGDTRGQIKMIKVLEDNSGGYAKANSEKGDDWGGSSGGGSKKSSGGGGGGDRQDSIVWQHSQEMAISLASQLLAAEAYAVKGKPDEKRVQIEGLVDELTARLFSDALDPRNSTAFKDNKVISEDSGEEESGGDDDGWSDDDEWS